MEAPRKGFWEVLDARASCRYFSSEPVRDDEITEILRAAKCAPSAGNLQAWRVFVLEGKDLLSKVGSAAYNQDWIRTAAAVLVFCADWELSEQKYGKRGKRLFSIQDATIACSYGQLACEALGLGACWVGSFNEVAVASILEAPNRKFRPVSLLVVGRPPVNKIRRSRRLELAELIKTEDWRGPRPATAAAVLPASDFPYDWKGDTAKTIWKGSVGHKR
jgi:nitroreductase